MDMRVWYMVHPKGSPVRGEGSCPFAAQGLGSTLGWDQYSQVKAHRWLGQPLGSERKGLCRLDPSSCCLADQSLPAGKPGPLL